MKTKMKYEGSCYIGVVGSEMENGECRDSIGNIQRRSGDSLIRAIRATKGYEARQMHFVEWLTKSDHKFMLLLDSDQVFPAHTLERLRSHALPLVSGFYMRRRYDPIAPVWFENTGGTFPLKPWITKVEKDTLYPIGASGWGCMLIHREVAQKVAELLKGEDLVIEDDMDVYPYDLDKVLGAIHEIKNLSAGGQSGEFIKERLVEISATLNEEIVPLRGVNDQVGSDIRFGFFAKKAGYQMMGDTGVMCSHMLNYPLSCFDFGLLPDEPMANLKKAMQKDYVRERRMIATRLAELRAR
jgi:hypothetical protein